MHRSGEKLKYKQFIQLYRMEKETVQYSVSPSGEKFRMPQKQDYDKELKRIKDLVAKARKEKKEIIVVMGLGFVGAVMAAICRVPGATGKFP